MSEQIEQAKIQDLSLEALRRADVGLTQARSAYEAAVVRCMNVGLSNRKIATAIGKTETAIRLYLKRKGHSRVS